MDKRTYQILELNKLIPYERNNKKHWKNIDEIVKSIQANTYITPIVCDENYTILSGHGRKLALDKMQVKEAEVLIVEGLTEEQKRDYRIRDNKLSGLSERDFWNLNIELEELWIEDLSNLFNKHVVEDDKYDEDIEDENPEAWDIVVQEWDIFQLWEHTLMCWDSMNEHNIQSLLKTQNTKHKTHCISDPPYWISYDNNWWHGIIKNDDKILDYTDLAKKYSNWYFCMRTGYQTVDKRIQLVQQSFQKLTNMIIRHKWGGWMWDCERSLAQDFEILLVNNRNNSLRTIHRWWCVRYLQKEEKKERLKKATKEQMKEILERGIDWISIRRVKKDNNLLYMHPTQKPVAINERVLENFTWVWENILDLFWWSGSNLIACEKLGRICYMMELDPKYVQVIIKKYNDVTKWQKEIKCINRSLDINLITNG